MYRVHQYFLLKIRYDDSIIDAQICQFKIEMKSMGGSAPGASFPESPLTNETQKAYHRGCKNKKP
jgi:hypothetical protein